MMTNGQWKYIWRPHSGEEQLLDLAADPQELRDVSTSPANKAILHDARQQLIQTLSGRPEGFVEDGRLIAGRPYARVIENAGKATRGAIWRLVKDKDSKT